MPTPQEQVRVVLVAPRNPLNIGAAARAISNFGFGQLRLVDAYDVAYQEAKSAVNAGAIIEASREYATVAEAVADCSLVVGTASLGNRELQHPLYRLEQASPLIRQHCPRGSVALLFGSERFGLSNEDMSHCHFLARIPTRPEHESMNLGQSVAVCLYELIRDTGELPAGDSPVPATGLQTETATALLLDILNASGYVEERTAGSTHLKVRRLLRRLCLRERDAYVWLGMLRQVLWKLQRL